ncbi:MAG: V-type ATP synthase subunit F [Candidatus Syntrophoarchaeum sp. GoM_oil]|nr:MAG: V-type ATP synthase subunit F [Candidatus Syntrophoarchaeum sp. GoM_oil]
MDIAVIADHDTATGFRLAGITRTWDVNDPEDALPILNELSSDENCGIIITTERIADNIRGKIDEINDKKKGITPIVVEVPDKQGTVIREVDPLRELIKKAIGVEM